MSRTDDTLSIVYGAASWRGFDSVRSLRFKGDRAIFTALSGRQVSQTLNRDFLFTS